MWVIFIAEVVDASLEEMPQDLLLWRHGATIHSLEATPCQDRPSPELVVDEEPRPRYSGPGIRKTTLTKGDDLEVM